MHAKPRAGGNFAESWGAAAASFFDLVAIDGRNQRIPRRKVPVQRARARGCLLGNVVEAGLRAGSSKGLLGYSDDAFAIALGIAARGRGGGFGWQQNFV